MTANEILQKAREIYDEEMRENQDGGPAEGSCCADIALVHAGRDNMLAPELDAARRAFAEAAGFTYRFRSDIFGWHDTHTKSESLAAFDGAIKATA